MKVKFPSNSGPKPSLLPTKLLSYRSVNRCDNSLTRWSKVSSFCPGTHTGVKNLDVGEEYEFRVSAENEFGVGEPLTTEEAIKARLPFGESLYAFTNHYFKRQIN